MSKPDFQPVLDAFRDLQAADRAAAARKQTAAEELLDQIEVILNLEEMSDRPYDATDRAIAIELIERYIADERADAYDIGLDDGRAGD